MNIESKPPTQKKSFITQTLPADVLLGRGSHLIRYQGNVEFRRLIRSKRDEYIYAANTNDKESIAQEVIDMVTNTKKGRFLRKVVELVEKKKLNIPTNISSVWVPAEADIVLEKVKQAFRDSCKDDGSVKKGSKRSGGITVPGTVPVVSFNMTISRKRNAVPLGNQDHASISDIARLTSNYSSEVNRRNIISNVSPSPQLVNLNRLPSLGINHEELRSRLLQQHILSLYQQSARATSSTNLLSIPLIQASPVAIGTLDSNLVRQADAIRQLPIQNAMQQFHVAQSHRLIRAEIAMKQRKNQIRNKNPSPIPPMNQQRTNTSISARHLQNVRAHEEKQARPVNPR